MATLALKAAINFLLVVSMVTEIIKLVNFCSIFLDYYSHKSEFKLFNIGYISIVWLSSISIIGCVNIVL
jgi:hypothetical protein